MKTKEQEDCSVPHLISIEPHTNKITYAPEIKDDGDCVHGCCTDYKCTKCGYEFRVEWPD